MAYQFVELPARLSLHSSRRQSWWQRMADLSKSDDHDAAWWIVARRQLDVCFLGRVSRPLIVAKQGFPGRTWEGQYHSSQDHHISAGNHWMGIFQVRYVRDGGDPSAQDVYSVRRDTHGRSSGPSHIHNHRRDDRALYAQHV